MWHVNLCHDFRYGKIMYNQLDQYVGKSLRLYGEYSQGEADFFGQIVKPGHLVVEAGANIGSHTIHLAQLAGDEGQVWAFEPQRLVFQLLAGNVALNSLTNVHCLQKCLGDADGSIVKVPVLNVNVVNNWGGLELGNCAEGEPVEQITIDSLDLPRCDFFKIDVEGMELQVLRGAEKTIRKYQPVIYTEADRQEKNGALFAYLRSLGYRLYWHEPPLYNPDNYFHNSENVFAQVTKREDGSTSIAQIVSSNVLCLPKDSPIKLDGFTEVE
ncbi:MAG: FkbM family methyltransferase [Schwartzia sp.]|nr:FkbM family methyltransferase [Schwartzia sp. (in: firmicutes)]